MISEKMLELLLLDKYIEKAKFIYVDVKAMEKRQEELEEEFLEPYRK